MPRSTLSPAERSALVRIAARIRSLRERADLTQEELADLIGIDRSYMGRIERGEYNFTIRMLLRISAGLKVPVSEIIGQIRIR